MSLRYKVPQNVQREDQIIWFITMKQLIIILVTGGISYMFYVQLSKLYVLSGIEIFFIFTPLIIGVAFAFLKIKGISLFKFCLLMIEQSMFLPPRRFWQPNTHTFVSMTENFSFKENKEAPVEIQKDVSQEKIKNLAKLLDGQTASS